MAKAGYLHLFDQLAVNILIPEAVAQEIQAAPAADPARKALESGWGKKASQAIPSTIVEWGLGSATQRFGGAARSPVDGDKWCGADGK